MIKKFFVYNTDGVTSANKTITEFNRVSYLLPVGNMEYHRNYGLFENTLIEWCKQFCNKAKSFVDIGAHTGTYSISLAPYCNHVHAFEPQKDIFYALCGGIALSNLNNVSAYNLALGAHTQIGTATLYVEPNDGGGTSLIPQEGYEKHSTEIYSLDYLAYTVENIGFIKIDAEGSEYNILLGAKEILKLNNYPPILFENNQNNITSGDVVTLLQEYGYNIVEVNNYPNMFLATKD